jgi:hypothetical protein
MEIAAAIIGSIVVCLNADYTVSALGLPDAISSVLRSRLAGSWMACRKVRTGLPNQRNGAKT